MKKERGNLLLGLLILVLVIVIGGMVVWQIRKGKKPSNTLTSNQKRGELANWKTYRNEKYGFELKYPKNLSLTNEFGETYFSFPAPDRKGEAKIYISVEKNLSVPLPGTAGGRYQYTAGQPLEMKVFSEKGTTFNKDYFIAYGGMGSWDTAINAYQYKNGNYYILSLYRSRNLGVPGAIVKGKKLTKKEIISTELERMRKKTDACVKTFNQILSTFQFIH